MALALIEAGARAVYCVDLPKEPSEEWSKTRDYAAKLTGKGGEGRLEYVSADVTDQVCAFSPSTSLDVLIGTHGCAPWIGQYVESRQRYR